MFVFGLYEIFGLYEKLNLVYIENFVDDIVISSIDKKEIEKLLKNEKVVQEYNLENFNLKNQINRYLYYKTVTKGEGKDNILSSVKSFLSKGKIETQARDVILFLVCGVNSFFYNHNSALQSIYQTASKLQQNKNKEKFILENTVYYFQYLENGILKEITSEQNEHFCNYLKTLKIREYDKKTKIKLLKRKKNIAKCNVYSVYIMQVPDETLENVSGYTNSWNPNTIIEDIKRAFPSAQGPENRKIEEDSQNEQDQQILQYIKYRNGCCTCIENENCIILLILDSINYENKKLSPYTYNKIHLKLLFYYFL